MPHRLICIAILVCWGGAATALFPRARLPIQLVGPPPDMRTVALAEDDSRPVRWAILVPEAEDGEEARSVGQATPRAERKRDGWFAMHSDAWIDSGELLKGTPL